MRASCSAFAHVGGLAAEQEVVGGAKKSITSVPSSFARALEKVSDLLPHIRGGGADIEGGIRWGLLLSLIHI